MLLGIIFVLAGTGYLFKAWNLLYSTAGVVFGAGYTDVHAGLPGMRVMMVIGWALGALLVYNAFWRRRWRWPLFGIGVWVVALIVVRGIVPGGLAVAHREPEPAGQGAAPTSPTTSPPRGPPTTSTRSPRPSTR